MENLIKAFVKYPFYANIIVVVLMVFGSISYLNMKKSFFPETEAKIISIQVAYPGASPKEMEEGVTTRIEESVRGIVGIKEITSTSSENFASVTIESTGQYDLDEMLTEVKNAVDGISGFPVDAEPPVIFKQRPFSPAMQMALYGEADLLTLKAMAEDIEDEFLRSGVMSQIALSGYPALELSVEVSEEDLRRYGLTIDQVSAAIALNNSDVSGGQIKSDEQEVLIRSRARSVDPNKIAEIVLRANPDGSFLRVRDVAQVRLAFADVASESLINGKQAVYFRIDRLTEEDLEAISDYCNQYAANFNAQHQDVSLVVTFDRLELLNSRFDLLITNGIQGLVLVVLALSLFLSIRLSFWVAWGIPSAFLAMFIVAALSGVTINMISLFGMILVVGILVDDGIVIGENVFTHFKMGKSPARAAVDGTMEVLPSVITSVTTTIVAFLPLFLIEGSLEFMYEMAFVVVFSLAFSLLEAFFVLPAHLANSNVLKESEKGQTKTLRDRLDDAIDYLRDKLYGRLLLVIIRHKWVMATLPVALILLTVGLVRGGFIQATFFPFVQFDTFSINLAFTPGAGEARTKEFLVRFEKAVWEANDELMAEHGDTVPYVKYTFATMGSAFSGQEAGGHAGSIEVILRNMEGAAIAATDVSTRVREKIGPVPEADKFTVGGGNRWGSPVSYSLLGKDGHELELAKAFFKEELAKLAELDNINDNNAEGKLEVQLELKPQAYFLGLNHAAISNQVRQGFFGGQAQRLQMGRDELRVWVRYPEMDRLNLGQLEQMKIKTALGEYPLSELADYQIARGYVNIKRFNGQKEVRVEADLKNPADPVPPILARIDQEIIPQLNARFPGVLVEAQGQAKRNAENTAEMKKYFGLALAVIALILMIHFKSGLQAVLVLFMIPLGWLGALWGHGIEGFPVSTLSAWGMIALSGVVINDAVVFLSKYNSLLEEGKRVQEAAHEAGTSRLRAILLTTITTTLGLYPLILEKSVQAQFLIPMAISLAYGVLVGTVFILLFFPALILVANDLKMYAIWFWTGKRLDREHVEVAVENQQRNID